MLKKKTTIVEKLIMGTMVFLIATFALQWDAGKFFEMVKAWAGNVTWVNSTTIKGTDDGTNFTPALVDDGVDSAHYAAGSIDAEHLAADIIDETKLADDSIDSEHYNANSIDEEHINWGSGAGQISTDNITEGSTNLYANTEEEVEDFVGGMLGGTETHISVTYQDASNDVDFVVDPASVAGAIAEGELANSIVVSDDIKDDTIDSADYAADSIDNEHINWADIDNLGDEGACTLSATVTVTDDENTDDEHEIVFTTDAATMESDGNLTYNPSSGTITATEFSGGGSGLTGIEGTQVLSTGEGGGTKYLREDGDGTCSWQTPAGGGTMSSFFLEDADGTEVEIDDSKEVKFIESTGIDINWTDTSTGSDADPFDLTFTISASAIAGAIAEGELANSIVVSDDIKDDTIDSADYAAGSIDAEHLAADIIDESKIADNGIDSEHYNDGSIDAVHLAADIIDETKIADNGIDSEHYNDGSIDAAHLAADIIDESKIADNGIDSEHYNDGSIDHEHLAADVISGMTDVTSADADYFLLWDATDSALKKCDGAEVRGGAGGSSEVSVMILPQGAKLPSSNPAVIDAGDNNWRLLYDDSTNETATWEFVLDDDYGAGTLYADIYFSMASTQTNVTLCSWGVYAMALTADTDSDDVGTDSYDTINYGNETFPSNLTAGYVRKATATLTNDDSLAAGDYIRLKIMRDADGDNATGDAEFIMGVIRE